MPAIDAAALFADAALEHPYPLYERMRELAPVCRLGDSRAFFIGSHAAVEETVRRHQVFSANLEQMLVCDERGLVSVFDLRPTGNASRVIATADEPEHAVHRRLLLKPLKAPRIAALEPELRQFAAAGVQQMLQQGGGDFCAALAEPLPAWVVIRLLGLADDTLELVRRWAMMGGDFLAGRLDTRQVQEVLTEADAQQRFLGEHFDRVSALPSLQRGESLTTTLVEGAAEGLISRDQAVGILVVLFGAAGESTASLLGSAVRLLAMDPLLQRELRSRPEGIPAFIEEVIRLESPFKFHYRVVREDTSLCGTPLQQDDLLLVSWAAANRDPAAWPQPTLLDLGRPRPERHLGFGYGIHYCIGAPLARLEVRVALEELLARSRRIRLDPAQVPVHVPSIFVRRLGSLQLAID